MRLALLVALLALGLVFTGGAYAALSTGSVAQAEAGADAVAVIGPPYFVLDEQAQQAYLARKTAELAQGLRRSQTEFRSSLRVVERSDGVYKIHPILAWTKDDIRRYMADHDLPYHPLWEQGYVSIGDVHSTRRLEPGMLEEDTRFFGLKRECGLHEEWGQSEQAA